ncbi:MAG: thioesterase family protein [Nocardioides sp.]
MRHVFECPLRRTDLDPGGTVDPAVYADYLQEARLDLLRHHDTSVSPEPDEGLVVVRTVIDYAAPLRPADAPLYVAAWIVEVRAASFTLGYELFTRPDPHAEPVVHARATTVLTPYVFSAERPRRLSHDERVRLSDGCEPAPVVDGDQRSRQPWGPGSLTRAVHVRFSDVDLLGHVNNVRYVDYLQDAQADLAADVSREAGIDERAALVVTRIEIDYVGQLNLRPEPYDVSCRVEAVGTTSVTFGGEIRDGDRVMARCRIVTTGAGDDGRPTAIDPVQRELFERRLDPALLS